jgi:hypothetical protein
MSRRERHHASKTLLLVANGNTIVFFRGKTLLFDWVIMVAWIN